MSKKIYGVTVGTPLNPNKNKTVIANDLDTKDPNAALSANMGNVLKEKIETDLLTVQKDLEADIKQRVKSVNGVKPDENGNVEVQGGSGGSGEPGADGFSPIANVTQTASGAVISITDKSGTTTATIANGKDGEDGYTPVKGKDYTDGQNGVSATHSWNGTTLTITSASGTSSANLKGEKGDKGDTVKGDDGISPTVAVSKSGKVTTISITDKNGTKTATVNDGADGKTPVKGTDYVDGKDGTSVTVKSVSESTADGGSNVVTFSDGKTVTIKNGSKGTAGKTPVKGVDYFDGTDGHDGNDGYTPVRGVDYWTTADKAEIEAYLATELAKRGQLQPEYADSIEKCTDTTKLYVLPDGFIYAYMEYESTSAGGEPLFTNRAIPTSSDWKTDSRFSSSSGSISSCTGSIVTNAIAAKKGDIIRIKGLKDGTGAAENAYFSFAFYKDAAGTTLGFTKIFPFNKTTTQYTYGLIDVATVSDGITQHTLFKHKNSSGSIAEIQEGSAAVSIRVAGVPVGSVDDIIVTVNEEIKYSEGSTEKGYRWQSTGHAFVSANYEPRIIDLEEQVGKNTADIATLKNGAVDTGGVDALTWIRNWDSPIYDRVPVFQLSAENPAVTSADKTVDGVYAKYDALMSANPRYITKTNMGMCSDGVTPVYRYDFREPEPHHQSGMQWSEEKPTIIIVSGIHIEWGGIYSLYYALKEITENPELDDLRRNVHFVVVPVMNPYCIVGAYSTNYGVQNANGVEIHRNFEVGFKYPGQSGYIEPGNRSHGGTAPLSEVESQYIDNLFKQYPDAALFLTCHSAQRDTRWGTGFIWASTATEYTCNLGYRLVDKLSKAWHKKYGKTWEDGCVRENNFVLADPTTYPNGVQLEAGDYRAGHAHVSSTNGTETRQATKYGIQGANVEVLDTFWVLSSTGLDSKLTTHGAEVYINYLLMYMGCYDHKDKKQYYIG